MLNSVVTKSLLREEEWHKLRMPANGTIKSFLMNYYTEFVTNSTGSRLKMLGRMKCWMHAECEEDKCTMVYVV